MIKHDTVLDETRTKDVAKIHVIWPGRVIESWRRVESKSGVFIHAAIHSLKDEYCLGCESSCRCVCQSFEAVLNPRA